MLRGVRTESNKQLEQSVTAVGTDMRAREEMFSFFIPTTDSREKILLQLCLVSARLACFYIKTRMLWRDLI